MRFRNLATVAAAALLVVPSTLLGQSIAEAAAKEKARRKALEESRKKPARSATPTKTSDAPRARTRASPSGPDATAAAEPAATKEGAPGAKPEKTEDEKKAEATAAWRKKLDAANAAATTYRDQLGKIQNDLNDTSGGLDLRAARPF